MNWFDDMFEHTIDYQLPDTVSLSTDTQYHAKVVGAPAQVEKDSTVLRLQDGTEITGTHRIATAAPLEEDARVWVDGEDNYRTVRLVKRASMDGDTLYEVRLA